MTTIPPSQPTTSNPKAKTSSCFETPKTNFPPPEKTQTKTSNPKRKKTSTIFIQGKNPVKTSTETKMQLH